MSQSCGCGIQPQPRREGKTLSGRGGEHAGGLALRSMMDAAQPPTADSSMCARPVAETTNGLHVEDLHEISSERDTEWTESLMDERETESYSIKCE